MTKIYIGWIIVKEVENFLILIFLMLIFRNFYCWVYYLIILEFIELNITLLYLWKFLKIDVFFF